MLLLLIGWSLLTFQAKAQSFTDTFDDDPCGGSACESFSRTLAGLQFDFVFTSDGDGGDFIYDDQYGEGGSPSINALSYNNDIGSTENITIKRNDGGNFIFNSIYLINDNNQGEDVTAQGYLDGSPVAPSAVVSDGENGVYDFGGVTVDEVRISSRDFYNFNFDSFSGELPSLPAVSTGSISTVTAESAQINNNEVTSDGGAMVDPRGVVVGTSTDPVRGGADVLEFTSGTGEGTFDVSATGLIPSQQYYARAFAVSSEGTSYGSNVSFTTDKKNLTISGSFTTVAKTYDGSTSATIDNNNLSLDGIVSGANNVSLDNIVAAFTNADTGSSKTVAIISADISGTDAGRYNLDLSGAPTYTNGIINPKVLTVSGAQAESRAYNGTTDAAITGASLDGVLGGDDVTLDNAGSGTFNNAGPADNIPVTPDFSISGTDAGNYDLTLPTGLSADIKPRAVVTSISRDGDTITNNGTVSFTVAFNEDADLDGSMLDVRTTGSLSGVSVDNVTAGLNTSHTVTINTGSGDGNITVTVPADAAQDQFGNALDETSGESEAYTIDKTAPGILSVTAQQSSPTLDSVIVFDLEFNEAVEAPALTALDINNGVFAGISGAGNTWELMANPENLAADVIITARVLENEVVDLAGNPLINTDSGSIDYDGVMPVITGMEVVEGGGTNPLGNLTSDTAFDARFTFNEDITGFDENGLALNNVALIGHSMENNVLTLKLEIPEADRDTVLTAAAILQAGGVSDLAGNKTDTSSGISQGYDGKAPEIVSFDGPNGDATNQQTFELTVTFSEHVTHEAASQIQIDNGSLAGITPSDGLATSFRLDILADDGAGGNHFNVTLEILSGAFADTTGNANKASVPYVLQYDAVPPEATFFTNADDPTNADDFILNIDFGEAVEGFVQDDIIVDTAYAAADLSAFTIVDIDSGIYAVQVTPREEGAIRLSIPAGAAQDTTGNNSREGMFTITVDQTAPAVDTISSTVSDTTTANEFVVTFSFDEPVYGFEQADIDVSNAVLSGFAGQDGDEMYDVTVSPSSGGLIALSIGAAVAQDEAGHDNMASDTFEVHYVEPSSVVLVSPEDSANAVLLQPEFIWEEAAHADMYELQVAFDTGFASGDIVLDTSGITALSYAMEQMLEEEQMYYWRVRGYNENLTGDWSVAGTFTTGMVTGLTQAGIAIAPEISLYPNPARHMFTLEASHTSIKRIRLMNMQGQVMKDMKVSGVKQKIDITNLSSGFYMIDVYTGRQVIRERVQVFR